MLILLTRGITVYLGTIAAAKGRRKIADMMYNDASDADMILVMQT